MATSRSADIERQAERTWISVVRAYHLCEAVMAEHLAEVGVRLAEHEVLANLVREPGMSQQTLAAKCFTAKSHISALLGTLEGRGLVRREPDPADARARKLYLTRQGEAVARQTMAVQAKVVAAMTKAVPTKDMAFIEEAMKRVGEKLAALRGDGV